jgi:hypothetical protein
MPAVTIYCVPEARVLGENRIDGLLAKKFVFGLLVLAK